MNSDDTTSHALEELHIASGIHAGSRVPLPARGGAQVVCIGQGDSNDILLADASIAPRHAELRSRTDGWDVLVHADASDVHGDAPAPRAWIPMPLALRLGDDVWLAIAPGGSEIKDATHWQQVAVGASGSTPADGQRSKPADAESRPLPPRRKPTATRRHALLASLLLGLACLLTPRLPSLTQLLRAAPMPTSARASAVKIAPPARPAPPVTPTPLAAILAAPRWSGLRVSRRADGVFVVSGRVPDRDSYDDLANQLSRVTPRPALNVLTGDDIRNITRSLLDSYAPLLSLDYDEQRVITLTGAALNPGQVEAVTQRLRSALPDFLIETGTIDYPDDIVKRTDDALVAAGFTHANAQWDGQRIVVGGNIPDGRQASVNDVLQQLDAHYRNRVAFLARLPGTGDTAGYSSNPLPFAIRSVVGGNNPYIMTADGTIVAPGGIYSGWHLKAIEPDRIVFDSPRTLMVQR
ncbi:type III secretion system inner membrane ring subunit SctD [Paraburkholderia agricolaris]|uniref:type III secretion system inner membrane ring subunit SctD n=1 Tax=Paraburkholderia agricolaris TaxID=2152888 RepID=UPI001291CAA7|nr:type III secretion system inner membrane ring subunit SctD [Paraburkholderia agricolaris]